MTCPGCHVDVKPTKVGFTSWGGVIGPRLLSHVECPACHTRFNGKTGQSNDQAIRIYVFCAILIAIAACFAIYANLG